MSLPGEVINGGVGDPAGQVWSASGYAANARFVADLGVDVLRLLDPKPGERILDLGCGDGALTAKILQAGADVLGVDSSAALLDAARERGLNVREMDGHRLDFTREFDAVFSNAALHWMTKPELVVKGIARALKPGGRFVAELGGHGNVAAVVTALRATAMAFGGDAALASPWYFPAPHEYARVLHAAGFTVAVLDLVPRPTPLPTGIEGWLATFAVGFFNQFNAETKPAAESYAIELLRPSLCDGDGQWTADYVRLRVAAHLNGAP